MWVSKEERILLEAKMKHYGYKTIAKYVRDAVIYENVTYVDLKGKQEMFMNLKIILLKIVINVKIN